MKPQKDSPVSASSCDAECPRKAGVRPLAWRTEVPLPANAKSGDADAEAAINLDVSEPLALTMDTSS